MKKYNITVLLILFELSCFHGHAILKREANEADTYKVREDEDTLEIINPKANNPTLREIIYYHVIEKPYPGKQVPEENNDKTQFHDVIRPFTNGHGFQYLKYPDENNSLQDKELLNHEPIHDEDKPKIAILDETGLDDLKRPDEINDGIKDELPNDMIALDEVINDKEKRPIPEKTERMRRRKREIDYSKLPSAPPLPAFRMDILPDYIKEILPTENEFSLTLKSPEFKAKSAEKPVVPNNTEEPEIRTEKSGKTESYVPKISIRIGDDEIHDEQIPIKPQDTDHNIIKKSPRNVDDDIEAEIRGVLRKVTDGERNKDSQDSPSYGMDLIGNGGIVWSKLNNQHFEYNVGPDALNEETHDEQIPTKPQEFNNNDENKEVANEIANTFNELEHILEDILPNSNNLHENNNFNKDTTENDDIEIIFHKNKPKLITENENINKIEGNPPSKKDFIPRIDPRSLIDENDDKIEPKSVNPDNSIDLDTALNILEVLQEIVANSNNSGPYTDDNKDDSKVKLKDIAEPERERKHHKHKEGDKEKSNNNEIDDLLNNDKYWEWLKDSSQATLSLLMKRANGLIKEEVDQQIQDLVTKMMEEQGYQLPGKEPEKQDDDETKPTGENDKTKTDDESFGTDLANEESDVNPQVLDKLKKNDKWKWLTSSSEAYLGALMKRINKLIKEEVTRQVEHLMKYHMPSADQNKPSDNNDNKQSSTENTETNPEKGDLEENKTENPKKEKNNTNNDIETQKSSKSDFNGLENKDEAKSDKESHTEENKKSTETKKKPLITINAENSYGSSVGNEKVINLFIFNLNGTDLKNLKPISNGNGMFIFGTENNNNQETSETPTEQTDSSNVDSTTDSNKVEITTTTEEAKLVDEEKPNNDSEENSNKDENTTSSTEENKDISSKDKKVKDADSSKKETETISEDDKNKEKPQEKESKGDEKDSKGDEKDSKGNEKDSEGDEKDSEGDENDSKGDEKDIKGDEKDSQGNEKKEVKSESKDETD